MFIDIVRSVRFDHKNMSVLKSFCWVDTSLTKITRELFMTWWNDSKIVYRIVGSQELKSRGQRDSKQGLRHWHVATPIQFSAPNLVLQPLSESDHWHRARVSSWSTTRYGPYCNPTPNYPQKKTLLKGKKERDMKELPYQVSKLIIRV